MSTHNICFYGELTKNEYPQRMFLWRTDEKWVPTTYVFMENWRKLSFNYHHIPSFKNCSTAVPYIVWVNSECSGERLRCLPMWSFSFGGGGEEVMAHQYYFSNFEPSQSYGGAKLGDPQEKPPDHPQAELTFSLIPKSVPLYRIWLELTAGSVIPKHDLISPASSGVSHRCFCSSVPYLTRTSMLPVSGAEQLNTWNYCKNSKNFDTCKICCNYPKIWTRWLYRRVMHPKDAD